MPQSSDTLRGYMTKWFGDPVGDTGPAEYLELKGYTLTKSWFWQTPAVYHTISDEEIMCILFLIEEWDFGGLAPSWKGQRQKGALWKEYIAAFEQEVHGGQSQDQ